jgi:hypothetical protein
LSVFATDKLIEQARKLASEYRRSAGKPLAGISVEIAEYDAANLLNLEICNPRVAGHDAVGKGQREGKRIQIKGRVVPKEKKSSGTRIGQLQVEQDWDSVVLVLLNEDYEPMELYEAERDVILENLPEQEEAKRNKRGAMSIGKFKHIARLVWSHNADIDENDDPDDSRATL